MSAKKSQRKMRDDLAMPLWISEIEIADGRREIDGAAVKRLAESIKKIGLRHPVTVRRKGDHYILVAGRHRIEAFKNLKQDHIPATIVTTTNDDARLWEIAENLHRADLSNIEKAEAIEEWRKITAGKVVNGSPPSGGKQPSEVGARKTAKALGVDHATVLNARKIAHIEPAAKAAAMDTGVTTVRELVEVSHEQPERQIAKVHELAAKRSQPVVTADEDEDDDDDYVKPATPTELRNSFLVFSNEARLLAKYEGRIDDEILASARATASAWCQLLEKFEQTRPAKMKRVVG